jgi:hypothetical protein
VTVAGGVVELSGRVVTEAERQAAEAAVARIPGVVGVHNGLVAEAGALDALAHGQFRHGEERSWGGYGGSGYDREPGERDKRQE